MGTSDLASLTDRWELIDISSLRMRYGRKGRYETESGQVPWHFFCQYRMTLRKSLEKQWQEIHFPSSAPLVDRWIFSDELIKRKNQWASIDSSQDAAKGVSDDLLVTVSFSQKWIRVWLAEWEREWERKRKRIRRNSNINIKQKTKRRRRKRKKKIHSPPFRLILSGHIIWKRFLHYCQWHSTNAQ